MRERFQSTRPMRGATQHRGFFRRRRLVSIHAPHAGRDRSALPGPSFSQGFNPRAPCGARPRIGVDNIEVLSFNPRAPCGARPLLL